MRRLIPAISFLLLIGRVNRRPCSILSRVLRFYLFESVRPNRFAFDLIGNIFLAALGLRKLLKNIGYPENLVGGWKRGDGRERGGGP